MEKLNPYEYHNDKLGVQGRFIWSGRNAHEISLCLIGDRGFRMRVASERIKHLRSQAPNFPMLVEFHSLPFDWQNAIVERFGEPQRQVRKGLFERYYTRDITAFEFYTNYQYPDGSFIKRTDKCNRVEEYTINASVLNLINEIYIRRRKFRTLLKGKDRDGFTGEKKISVWETICNDSNLFRAIINHTLPQNSISLKKRLNEYNAERQNSVTDGYKLLIHGQGGNQNARIVTDDIEQFLNDLFAGQEDKPTPYKVYEQYESFLSGYIEVINENTGEIYDPKDFKKLSKATVTSYLAKWQNRIGTYAVRSGDRQIYMSRFKPYHSLNQPKFSGSIISIDDRQPPFEYAKGLRTWFYNGIDLGSEAFICWVWGKSKDGIILDFYRQLVRNFADWGFNIPAELEAESSLNSSFKNTFLQEGAMFQYVRIEANNARGKRIERYYGELRYRHEKERKGWLARPKALSEPNEAGAEPVPTVPYDEIIHNCLCDIEDWNNTEHSKIKGKTRWEVFCETQHPDIRPTNYRAIIPYLGYRTETSCKAGIMKLQNSEFLLGNDGLIATGDNLINLMQTVEGRDINVYWLDSNDGKILKAYVYIGEQLICEAIAKPTYSKARIEQTAEDLANRELMSKYVATIESFGRQQKNKIEKVTVINNKPKTLNRKFTIPNVNRYIKTEYTEAKILPEIENEAFTVSASTKTSLVDRF